MSRTGNFLHRFPLFFRNGFNVIRFVSRTLSKFINRVDLLDESVQLIINRCDRMLYASRFTFYSMNRRINVMERLFSFMSELLSLLDDLLPSFRSCRHRLRRGSNLLDDLLYGLSSAC